MAKEVKNKEKKIKTSKQAKGKGGFVKDTKAELKKVIWPGFEQLTNNTLAVISVVVIIAVIVFVLDLCFDKVNSLGIEKLKDLVQVNEITESETSDVEFENDDVEVSEEGNVSEDVTDEEITETEEVESQEN